MVDQTVVIPFHFLVRSAHEKFDVTGITTDWYEVSSRHPLHVVYRREINQYKLVYTLLDRSNMNRVTGITFFLMGTFMMGVLSSCNDVSNNINHDDEQISFDIGSFNNTLGKASRLLSLQSVIHPNKNVVVSNQLLWVGQNDDSSKGTGQAVGVDQARATGGYSNFNQ